MSDAVMEGRVHVDQYQELLAYAKRGVVETNLSLATNAFNLADNTTLPTFTVWENVEGAYLNVIPYTAMIGHSKGVPSLSIMTDRYHQGRGNLEWAKGKIDAFLAGTLVD